MVMFVDHSVFSVPSRIRLQRMRNSRRVLHDVQLNRIIETTVRSFGSVSLSRYV